MTREGIVVCVEKKAASKLLAPTKGSDKVLTLDGHVFAAVAGMAADANILVSYARLCAQRYTFTYGEPQPVEGLVTLVSDYMHSYTQYGGLRPFGVAFLFAGWDRHHGFQLYQADPAGNYTGWKATAIGGNSTSAMAGLRSDFSEQQSLADATKMAVRVLTKAMDTTTPTADKVEVVQLTRDAASGACAQRMLSADEVGAILRDIAAAAAPAGDV